MYRKILYSLSLILAAGSVLCVLWFGIRVYPAAAFLGILGGDEKIQLAKSIALPCIACAASVLLTADRKTRLSVRTISLLIAVDFVPTAAFIIFNVQSVYIGSYQIAAAIFALSAAAVTSVIIDYSVHTVIDAKKLPFILCALLIAPIFSAAIYLNISNSLLLLPLILYSMPVAIVITAAALYFCVRYGFSRLCEVSIIISGLVMPVGILVIPYKTDVVINITAALFVLFCTISIILIIYNFKRINMANINKVIPGLGFHHIGLKVKDFEKSFAFYTALGLTPIVSWGEGNGRVQMFDLGDGGILEMFAGGSDELAPVGNWQHFAMKCDDVDAAYEKALSVGARPHISPKDAALDSKPEKMLLHIAFVLGPDDEQLEFFSVKSKG